MMISEKVLQICTIIFNIIILITGLIILGLGIWAAVADGGFKAMINDTLFAGIYLLIVAGVLIVITASMGIFVALSKEKKRIIVWIYAGLLLLTVVMKIVGVILTFVFYEDASDTLKNSYLKRYGNDADITSLWDNLQQSGQCCGFNRYSNWEDSDYYMKNSRVYPASCCITVDPDDMDLMHCTQGRDGYINVGGCEFLIRQFYYGIGITAIIVIFIELLSVLFMACLFQYY